MQLNTGWKNWDLHLSRFITHPTRPIHILEIGSFEGMATAWFLNNLCNHNARSSVTAVDTWQGSPEYVGVNFRDIEKTFDRTILATGRQDQCIKLKGLSFDILAILLAGNPRPQYDIIYVDASHESRHVIADAVMSWAMLVPGGLMIFDDYKWNKLSPDYFTPKVAIDAFMHIMQPEGVPISVARQVFFQKKTVFESPRRVKTRSGGGTKRRGSRGRTGKKN
jgi:predicted O-methyltransferase YrrM